MSVRNLILMHYSRVLTAGQGESLLPPHARGSVSLALLLTLSNPPASAQAPRPAITAAAAVRPGAPSLSPDSPEQTETDRRFVFSPWSFCDSDVADALAAAAVAADTAAAANATAAADKDSALLAAAETAEIAAVTAATAAAADKDSALLAAAEAAKTDAATAAATAAADKGSALLAAAEAAAAAATAVNVSAAAVEAVAHGNPFTHISPLSSSPSFPFAHAVSTSSFLFPLSSFLYLH